MNVHWENKVLREMQSKDQGYSAIVECADVIL